MYRKILQASNTEIRQLGRVSKEIYDNLDAGILKVVNLSISNGRTVITEGLETLNGIKAFRISKGTNSSKVIVIGRNMEDVRLYKKGLEAKGIKVEIFDGEVIPLSAFEEFDNFKKRGIWLTDEQLLETHMYKANKEWIEKSIEDGYDIYDIGNLRSLAGDGLLSYWFSVFYEMERNIVFP